MRWIPRTKRSRPPGAFCPTCRVRSGTCRRGHATGTIRQRREEFLISAIPRDKRAGLPHAPHHRGAGGQGQLLRDGARFRPARSSPGSARLDGWPVALLAGDPLFHGGAWTADACNKIIRFVDMAQTFHLPIVHLVDCPGFQVGLAAESSAVIRWGVRALSAINQTTVPWCSIVVRNCYGVGGLGHQPVSHLCLRYAWPSASWGSLPLEGGIEAAYRAEIDAAPDPAGQAGGDRGAAEPAALAVTAPRRRSGSRRSSTRATPAACCASSPTWPRRCARRGSRGSPCGRRAALLPSRSRRVGTLSGEGAGPPRMALHASVQVASAIGRSAGRCCTQRPTVHRVGRGNPTGICVEAQSRRRCRRRRVESARCRRSRRARAGEGVRLAADRYPGPRLFPQGRRLPMGLSRAYAGARIHPPDRRRPLCRRFYDQLAIQRIPGDSRPHLRSPMRAGVPSRPRGRRTGGDLPAETRCRGLQGRHPPPPAEARRTRTTASESP